MKLALALIGLCSCVTANVALAPDRPESVSPKAIYVQGKAVIRDAHCGGVATSAESTALLERPAASLVLRLHVGRENVPAPAAAVVQTDAEGRFNAWLEPNTYCVVLGTRSRLGGSTPAPPEALGGHPSTPECLKALESSCDGELVVGARQTEVFADLAGKTCAWNSPCAKVVPAAAPAPAPTTPP